MAPRKSQPQRPESRSFTTVDEIDRSIQKLRRRLEDLAKLTSASTRYDSPLVDTAESALRATILEVFGSNSPEFIEHQYHRIWQGPQFINMSPAALQQGFEKGLSFSAAIVEGLLDRLEEAKLDFVNVSPTTEVKSQPTSRRIFVVHGRDDATLHAVARLLSQLELEPVVLREQPSRGRTIIEKFVDYSDVAFAIVLLTPDDRGGLADAIDAETALRPRARQNVILELGFFLGKLGRANVCALYVSGVEVPSDYSGVAFVQLDDGGGAWKLELARELRGAGLDVDFNKL